MSTHDWKKKYIIISISLLLFLVTGFCGIWFLTRQIGRMVESIDIEIAKNRVQESRLGKMSILENQHKSILEQKEKFLLKIDKEKTRDIITQIEMLSEQTGNRVKIDVSEKPKSLIPAKKTKKKSIQSDVSTQPGATASTGTTNPSDQTAVPAIPDEIKNQEQVSFTIQLLGTYESIFQFLKKLENAKIFTMINNVGVIRTDAEGYSLRTDPFALGEKDKQVLSASQESNQEVDSFRAEVAAEIGVTFFIR